LIHMFSYFSLPRPKIELGQPLRTGQKLPYKCNGMLSVLPFPSLIIPNPLSQGLAAFWISIITVLILHFYQVYNLARLHDLYLPLITVSCAFSFALALFCYINSFASGALLAEGGNSGRDL